MKRANELENARDMREAAELEARLTVAAENQLEMERQNDFIGEKEDNLCSPKKMEGTQSSSTIPAVAVSVNQVPAIAEVVHRPDDSAGASCGFLRNLPRLELTKFSGAPGEWPRWFALFQALVGNQAFLSDAEKMAHLQGAVIGPAQQTIAGLLYDGRLYHSALTALQDRYGRQEDIVHANMRTVFSCPPPTYLDPESMDRFHAAVHSAVSVLKNLGYEGDLFSTENLRNIVRKLPIELKKEWGHYVLELEPAKPNLLHLDDWLRRQVRVAMNFATVTPEEELSRTRRRDTKVEPIRRTTLITEVGTSGSSCTSCGGHHRVDSCPRFMEKDVNQRIEFVITSGVCFYCLKEGHRARHCRIAKQCGIDGCRMRHHHLLHGSRRVGRFASPTETSETKQERDVTGARVVAAASKADHVTTLLQVVRVKVLGEQGRSRIVNALLDPGAQTSLCCDEVLRDLQILGEKRDLQLLTAGGRETVQRAQRVTLTLIPTTEMCARPILVPEVFSVPDLHVQVPCLDRCLQSWDHVRDLDVAGYNGQKIELLLGANIIETVIQQEARVGKPGEPVAIKTAFGWALAGNVRSFVPEHVKQVMFLHKTALHGEHDFLQDWWSTESFGTKHGTEFPTSAEDRRALRILERTTKLVGNRYEVGLLWKFMTSGHGSRSYTISRTFASLAAIKRIFRQNLLRTSSTYFVMLRSQLSEQWRMSE
ncbi:uncharacterized protein LOC122374503 [Amphibalanus amphitrite]|uniref:uncharacterized protein LOC122374503 n=1 Tax=Amphibalanus amphitrite TaxID=1232801 RepID=UPI001C910A50|nr:uncharacterized protein LOC122374503 [Amphibalanus amphitrite]